MTTEGSVSEEDANQMLKDLQSWWEIPATAQYISLFRESFHLPETEIEELEKAFIDDTIKGPSTWLQNLLFAFVKSIIPGRGVNAENWELHLRKLIKRKCPVGDINPFDEDKSFQELTLRAKVLIVYSLCLHRLDRYDIADTMKSMDADALRVQKLGVDGIGNTYWYFYGTRLYKEEVEKKKTWDEEWKQQKKKSFKKRGRGRPRKRRTSDGESDGFEDVDKKDDGFMNVNEKSRWSVVCDTIEEWVNFAEKFKDSKSKDEAHLFKIIQENFLPTLNKIYEEKEKKLQQKIKELMPTREKIVTRRETRRLRGEDLDISPFVNGYDLYSSDETRSSLPGKSRAQRLEERNKRAIEAEDIQVVGQKKTKKNNSEYDSPARQPSESSDDDLQSRMEKLIAEIKLHKDAWPFLYPVSEEDAPGYYDIIKEPIDLSTIESRLFKGEYDTLGELYEDISKMVENCELYNGEFHNLSKMGQMLRLAFKKKLAEILESIELEQFQNADSEGSRDSHSHSGSNSNSALHSEEAASDSSSNASKKSKDRKKKKKKRAANALDLLAEATQLAVQTSNSNDMLNVSNMYGELTQSNDFSNLKILPIHSHPPSVIEKLASNTSVEHVAENESNPPDLSEEVGVNGHYVRSSPNNLVASTTSSESSSYNMNNLTHLSNFMDKNGVRKLNVLSNGDVASVLSNGESSQRENNSSPASVASNFSKGSLHSDNLQGLDNILDEYNENFISNLIKQPVYTLDNQLMSQNKDSSSPPYVVGLPKQDINFDKSTRKSPPSNFLGHSVADNIPLVEDNTNMQSDAVSPLNITTVDTSSLGMAFNPFSKNPGNSNVPVTQIQNNFASNEIILPNFNQQSVPLKKRSPIYRPKSKTPPNEYQQYFQPQNILNSDQTLNAASMPYLSMNMDLPITSNSVPTTSIQTYAVNSTSHVPLQVSAVYSKSLQDTSTSTCTSMPTTCVQTYIVNSTSNAPLQVPAVYTKSLQNTSTSTSTSMPTTCVQTYVVNSTSNAPLQVPAVYPKSVQKSRMQFHQQNNPLQVPMPQSNSQLMFVPEELNKGSALTYENYSQKQANQNVIQEHMNFLPNGTSLRLSPNAEKRMTNNQDNYATGKTSPPQKKSPVPQHTQVASTNVPSNSMPYIPTSASSSDIPNKNFTQAPQRERLIMRVKVPEKRKPTNAAATFNGISSTSTHNVSPQNNAVLPQNNIEPAKPKNVPLVYAYSNNLPTTQSDLRYKLNPAPVVSVQSNMCMPQNSLPVVQQVQQVLIPTNAQHIQLQNNGQFVFTAPQNTVRLITKEQTVQMLNSGGQVNQGFGKVMPQFVTTSPQVLQVSKDGMHHLQFQAVPQNNTQEFTQVTQSPQFTYMLTNQNGMNESSPQSVMNLQPYQLQQRQMHIGGQGNV